MISKESCPRLEGRACLNHRVSPEYPPVSPRFLPSLHSFPQDCYSHHLTAQIPVRHANAEKSTRCPPSTHTHTHLPRPAQLLKPPPISARPEPRRNPTPAPTGTSLRCVGCGLFASSSLRGMWSTSCSSHHSIRNRPSSLLAILSTLKRSLPLPYPTPPPDFNLRGSEDNSSAQSIHCWNGRRRGRPPSLLVNRLLIPLGTNLQPGYLP